MNELTVTTEEKPLNDGRITGKDPETGQFLPGNTLSKGKPKGTKHFATVFMEELKREVLLQTKDGDLKMTVDKAMARAMINKAIKGDVPAFNAVTDRVDGKPKQQHELAGEDGEPLVVQFAPVFNSINVNTTPKTGEDNSQ